MRRKLAGFFDGRIYPLLVAAMMFFAHVSALEFYVNILNVLLLAFGLCFANTVKPFIAVFLTYTYQISLQNTPSFPVESTYYTDGARPYIIILMFIVGFGAFGYSLAARGVFRGIKLRTLPLIYTSVALSAAFLLNGVFGGDFDLRSTLYGAAQIISIIAVFYVFYLAFLKEDAQDILRYLIYLSLLIGLIVSLETLHLYLTSDVLFRDGAVVKDNVLYGWGIWNNAGQKLTVVIPMLFLGVMRAKDKLSAWICFGVAALCLVCAVMTLSRTALILASVAFGCCAVISCFAGKNKKMMRIITLVGIVFVAVGFLILKDKIFAVLADYLERGMDDNGRFALWQYGVDSFLSSPIFGKGFFGLHTETFVSIGFIPQMMHNTPIQLLAAMGAVGTVAYAAYRMDTVRPFLRAPSLDKTLVGISLLTVLCGSLLENFVFYVEPMFYFSVLLALVFRIAAERKSID